MDILSCVESYEKNYASVPTLRPACDESVRYYDFEFIDPDQDDDTGKTMRKSVLAALLLGGCAQANVMPLGDNTYKITASAAPVCGQQGAERVAFKQAAVETIKRGFDRFRIMDGRYQNQVGVVGYTPMTSHTMHTGNIRSSGYGSATYRGSSNTYVSGGQPIIAGSHNQGLLVRMYRDGQQGAEGALSARAELGPKWQQIVKSPTGTCTG